MAEPSQKPRFYDLCIIYVPDYTVLEEIAKNASVDISIIGKMFVHEVIHRVDAEKVLAAFSQYVKQTYTLENTRVALFPSFPEITVKHSLDLSTLAIPYPSIEKLLVDEPISEQEAKDILLIISKETGQDYTLDNTDIRIEEVQHG